MKNEVELRDVVNKAKNKDLKALSKLYEEFFDRIFRYILFRVRRREEAEDLASQTFLRMVERIDTFKWRGVGFSAWLFRIAHNLVVDWFRGDHVIAEPSDLAQSDCDPEDLVIADESLREALKALGFLNEKQRQIILLRLVGGLTCRQTAEMLSLSEANVRTTQHRALEKIRDIVQVKIDV